MPVERSFLDIFKKITSDLEAERPEFCINLCNHLAEFTQNEIEICGGNTVPDEVMYTLKRLVQGLGAPRPSVRKCYFATLSVLLVDLQRNFKNEITLDYYKSIIDARLAKYESKGEEGEVLVGQILAYGTAIRSKIFLNSTTDLQSEICSLLLNNAKLKSYLPLLTYTFLIEYMRMVDEEQFKTVLWPVLKSEILVEWPSQTFETLLVLLELNKIFPSVLRKKELSILHTPTILHDQTVGLIFKLLTDITLPSYLDHPLYECVVDQINNSDRRQSLIDNFWVENIDSLILRHPTRPQQLAILVIFKFFMKCADISVIPDLLSRSFVEMIIKSCLCKTEVLAVKSKSALQSIVEKCLKNGTQHPSVVYAILRKLVLNSGNILIDKLTGVKVVNSLVSQLDELNVKKFGDDLKRGIMRKKDGSLNWNFSEKRYAIQLLARLICHPKLTQEINWKTDNLKFLLMNALLCPENHEISISNELAAVMKNSFFSCLNVKYPNLSTLRILLINLVNDLDQLLNSGKELRTPFSDSTLSIWQKTVARSHRINSNAIEKSDRQKISIVFHVLFLYMLLYLLIDANVAKDALEELEMCYLKEREMRKNLRKSKKQKLETNKSDDEKSPKWIEVVIELFLSLLPKDTSIFRQLISHVLPYLCSELTAQATYQILQILDPVNIDILSSENGPNSNKEEDSDEDTDMDNDENEDNEETDSEIEDNEDNIEETAMDKMRAAVHEALGIAGSVTDTESIDLDDVDEEEGIKLDNALSDAFKMVKRNSGKNKKQTATDKALTNFRIRALDMVDIYLDNNPSFGLVLDTIPVLFSLLEFCIKDQHQKQLEIRARSTLKKIGVLKKCTEINEVSEEIIAGVLKSLMDKGVRTTAIFLDVSIQITECCIFLTKMFIHSDMKNCGSTDPHGSVINVYKTALTNFFTKRDCLLPIALFENLLSRILWSQNIHLCDIALDLAFDASVRGYRRNQAILLIGSLYKNTQQLVNLDKELLKNFEEKLSSKVHNLLQSFKTGTDKSKEAFVREVISLMTRIKSNKHNGGGCNWIMLGKILPGMSSKFSSTAGRKSCNKLCGLLGVKNGATHTKSNGDAINGVSDSEDNQGFHHKENHKVPTNTTSFVRSSSKDDRRSENGNEDFENDSSNKNGLNTENDSDSSNKNRRLNNGSYMKSLQNIKKPNKLLPAEMTNDNHEELLLQSSSDEINSKFVNKKIYSNGNSDGIGKSRKLQTEEFQSDDNGNGLSKKKKHKSYSDKHADKIRAKKLRREFDEGFDVFNFTQINQTDDRII